MSKKSNMIFKQIIQQMLKVVCVIEKLDPMDVKVEKLHVRITTLFWELNDKDRKVFSKKWPNITSPPSEWTPRLRFSIKKLKPLSRRELSII